MSIGKTSAKSFQEATAIFVIGETGYSLLEVLWRGYTHWTMSLTGGLCFLLMYYLNQKMAGRSLIKKCLAAALLITLVEFAVGCLVNRVLHWQVWDYGANAMNLLGQVCLLYSLLWFLLAIPAMYLCGYLKHRYFSK
ncbi:MAG: hypothetical protein VB085_11145 [Peptococcaceae bacterium]|nr:hypothetical protein [Peptococcaceae bacterium]